MKKKVSILGALMLAVVVTGYSVSGTYAKYSSAFNGASDKATIGTWNVTVNEVRGTATTADFDFILFAEDKTNSTKDTETVIASGANGSGEIKLANLSNVDATYSGTVNLTANGLPIEISLKGGDSADDWGTSLTISDAELAKANDTDDTDEATITVYWRWSGADDAADTAAGIAAADAENPLVASATATITVAQKTA